MKIVFLALLLFVQLPVTAAESRHFDLARQFEALSSAGDKARLVDSIVPAFAHEFDEDEQFERFRGLLIEIMSSDEYANRKARAYMSLFTEHELELLVELVQSPAYKLMQSKRYDINAALMENMQQMLQEVTPQLIAEAKSGSGK